MCKICPRRGPLWTNASYCRVETQWDNVNKDLYWLRPYYSILTLIPSAFLLHFLFRLRKRIQVYCVQSLFTTLSVVCSQFLYTLLCPRRRNDLHHCVCSKFVMYTWGVHYFHRSYRFSDYYWTRQVITTN